MNLRFAGQYFDEETGTHYNQQRDYAPGLGRYIQRDPIGLSGGINVYGYGYGNPSAYADPDGLVPLALTPCVTSPQGAMACAALIGATATAVANACSNAVSTINDWMFSDGGGDEGNRFPDRDLPRDPKHGTPMPDPEAEGNPHTQLGQKDGRRGRYDQAREFDSNGKPVRDIDFTDHGRGHPNPHQHEYEQNPKGGTLSRGKNHKPVY
ncbi:RHS repeat-associated core domain-containing protein [Delftia sp. DLF01]|uniref:RHS repeat-associated core domain-containing protein n=1 Tax=Delftia sp. DLF01 TaxID=2769279 RepID=UPI001CE16FE6|nr:RHS repeat-associated core domain-containing protein [Delftia sp. DLF01]